MVSIFGGKLVLSNACLANLPNYLMAVYLLQDRVHEQFDKVRSRFSWEGPRDEHKYHTVWWASLCRPKDVGGLGIINTIIMNIALMLKWVWRLLSGDDSLWANLMRAKY